jgi:hypothetical protein
MTLEEAVGTISTVATRFTTVSLTVIFKPFHLRVAFWMSSPTFLGERPSGPTLGASAEAAPISPPIVFRLQQRRSGGGKKRGREGGEAA